MSSVLSFVLIYSFPCYLSLSHVWLVQRVINLLCTYGFSIVHSFHCWDVPGGSSQPLLSCDLQDVPDWLKAFGDVALRLGLFLYNLSTLVILGSWSNSSRGISDIRCDSTSVRQERAK